MGHYGALTGVKNTYFWGERLTQRQNKAILSKKASTNSQRVMGENWITAWLQCFSHSVTFHLMSGCKSSNFKGTNDAKMVSHVWYNNWKIKYTFLITSPKKQHILFMLMLKQERSPFPLLFFSFLMGVHYGSSFVLLTWYPPITLKHNPSLRQLILSSLQ